MSAPFFIFAPPRSRTAWLSAWLSYGGKACWHDALAAVEGVEGLKALYNDGSEICGFAETAGCIFPRSILEAFPDAKFLFVSRLHQHSVDSLNRLGQNGEAVMQQVNRAMSESIAYLRPRAPVAFVPMEHLDQADTLASLWAFLRGDEMPVDHTMMMLQLRITKKHPFGGKPSITALLHEEKLTRENPNEA